MCKRHSKQFQHGFSEIPAPTGVLLFVYACHMWKSEGGPYVNVKLHFFMMYSNSIFEPANWPKHFIMCCRRPWNCKKVQNDGKRVFGVEVSAFLGRGGGSTPSDFVGHAKVRMPISRIGMFFVCIADLSLCE